MNLAVRLYYSIKPFLPRAVRNLMRRAHARRMRAQAFEDWPIQRGSERPPAGWKGWPAGKKFAVVLTHDVEGTKGYNRVKDLANIEKRNGFRSSFNLIPEGPYQVEPELRRWLQEQGFEVGIHDLHHDGKLYRSHAGFSSSAQKINRYLREWKVSGFRSAYMHHNLEWIGELDIKYDASTFDTDPFEPQPDGVGTIFPFWVPRSGAALAAGFADGYVELPYTLVQDSTLFLFLGERGIDYWKMKVDWIAEHGGMVLLNLHPDYVNFDGGRNDHDFPVEHYEALLKYIRERHTDDYWHVLPQEVAGLVTPENRLS